MGLLSTRTSRGARIGGGASHALKRRRTWRHGLVAAAAALAVAAALLITRTGLQPDASAHSLPPADPYASTQARAVLDWLGHLPNRSGAEGNRVASGYFAGYSRPDFATSSAEIETLHTRTGQYPAVVACDYASGWDAAANPTRIDTACNTYLKQAAAAGSLVSVSVHAPNPSGGPLGGQPLTAQQFAQLTDRATAIGQAWHARLDEVAAGLKDLGDAGVPVLFRPLHEMNVGWFWWGAQDKAAFRAVWQDMVRSVTDRLGQARNVLWVYAPQCNYGGYGRDAYYPGDEYADVVGLDCYVDEPAAARGYEELTTLGKPFALTEVGPTNASGKNTPDPGFDYAKWTAALHTRFPTAAYFLAWNSMWSPIGNGNLHASELMNDPWVVNRGEVDLTRRTEPEKALLAGFEAGTEGWTNWNTRTTPISTTDWAAEGKRSLSAVIDLERGETFLNRRAAFDLSDRTTLAATVRTGSPAPGTKAKLYVRIGPDLTWYDSGPFAIGESGADTTLRLDLAALAGTADIREIGVDVVPASGAYGPNAIYVDDVRTLGPRVLAGFESGAQGWTGVNTEAGPWPVTEWRSQGAQSFKADVMPSRGETFLNRRLPAGSPLDLAGRTTLAVTARTAPWGDQATGTRAKLYIRTGPDLTWYDAGPVTVGPNGVTLGLDLSAPNLTNLTDVREIGITFTPAPNASGRTAVYVDNLTLA
ncbi:glycosyl hydrolase [Yinghuangia seranimata]|uniref:glycosyl hydrolase n=1 Tax=Yinghuangia seranimata TaxID=408067 RepID=UPI00248AC65B|nr:glycosyl hydrolase [Yinghuangia seranimata]MDI2126305.1 glycosyl hydrolase [Yinghuangia seranimata]